MYNSIYQLKKEGYKMAIKVFSTENCFKCKAVKRFLTEKGVEFTGVMVDKDPESLELLHTLGYSSVPVTMLEDGTHFGGFDLPKLHKLL